MPVPHLKAFFKALPFSYSDASAATYAHQEERLTLGKTDLSLHCSIDTILATALDNAVAKSCPIDSNFFGSPKKSQDPGWYVDFLLKKCWENIGGLGQLDHKKGTSTAPTPPSRSHPLRHPPHIPSHTPSRTHRA